MGLAHRRSNTIASAHEKESTMGRVSVYSQTFSCVSLHEFCENRVGQRNVCHRMCGRGRGRAP